MKNQYGRKSHVSALLYAPLTRQALAFSSHFGTFTPITRSHRSAIVHRGRRVAECRENGMRAQAQEGSRNCWSGSTRPQSPSARLQDPSANSRSCPAFAVSSSEHGSQFYGVFLHSPRPGENYQPGLSTNSETGRVGEGRCICFWPVWFGCGGWARGGPAGLRPSVGYTRTHRTRRGEL